MLSPPGWKRPADQTPAGARRRGGRNKGWPARQRNSSLLASARQLQAHVRRLPTMGEAEPHESARRLLLGLLTRMVSRHVRPGHLACGGSPQMLAENCQLVAKSRGQALDHVRSCD